MYDQNLIGDFLKLLDEGIARGEKLQLSPELQERLNDAVRGLFREATEYEMSWGDEELQEHLKELQRNAVTFKTVECSRLRLLVGSKFEEARQSLPWQRVTSQVGLVGMPTELESRVFAEVVQYPYLDESFYTVLYLDPDCGAWLTDVEEHKINPMVGDRVIRFFPVPEREGVQE